MIDARSYRCRMILVAASLLFHSACRNDAASPSAQSAPLVVSDPWFEEVAAETGIDFVHQSGHDRIYYMPEIIAGGVGLLDYDGDGFIDIYLVQAGRLTPGPAAPPGNRLYHNRGDGTFEDVTAAAGVGDAGYGMGAACGDYDNDGDTDIYVTNYGPNVLYRNNGDDTFTDVSDASGAANADWGTSCAFFDCDHDGDLDIFIANYLVWSPQREIDCHPTGTVAMLDYCAPDNYRAPARDVLLKNNGDGTFTDATVAAGLGAAFGNGLGVACGDYDNDGDIDICVANDGTANQLWVNDGTGTFKDQALIRGCALNQQGIAEAGMGIVPVDLDHDGDLDVCMSHLALETNTFYLNDGKGFFDDRTAAVGLAAPSWDFTGFGIGFFDFDLDGQLDMFVANGRVKMRPNPPDPLDPYAEPDQLFRGRPDGTFEEVHPRGGTAEPLVRAGRAAAFGDLDNDGDIDIVVVNKDGPAHLLRNTAADAGNWIMFRVRNAAGSDAVGARLKIESAGRTHRHAVNPFYSYGASNDPRIHCGLGNATRVDRVTVRWPDGKISTYGPFDANRIHELRQSE